MPCFITYRDELSHLFIMMNQRGIELHKFGVSLSERLAIVSFATVISIYHAFFGQIFWAVKE